MINFYNAILFYSIWWGCVLGARYSYTFLGPLLLVSLGYIHFKLLSADSGINNELKLIFYGGFFGLVVEIFHLYSGLLNYNGYIYENSLLPPAWILCMWIAFSGTLNYSMSWMKNKWILMILSGAIFGPLSYMAGINFNIISFNYNSYISYGVLSLVWAISVPILYKINRSIYEN